MTDFICEVGDQYSYACTGLPFYGEQDGKRYCVLHLPGEKNEADFQEVIHRKLEVQDFLFAGVHFNSDAIFLGATFEGMEANFHGATFEKLASFPSVTFGGGAFFAEANFKGLAVFGPSTFKGRAIFEWATFEEAARFMSSTFEEEVDFSGATFKKEVDLTGAIFKGQAIFNRATFEEGAKFIGAEKFNYEAGTFNLQAEVDFRDARIEKPELFSFHTVKLRPSWFIDVDARRFNFTNVEWYGLPGGPEGTPEDEIKELQSRDVESPHELLAKACRAFQLTPRRIATTQQPTSFTIGRWRHSGRKSRVAPSRPGSSSGGTGS